MVLPKLMDELLVRLIAGLARGGKNGLGSLSIYKKRVLWGFEFSLLGLGEQLLHIILVGLEPFDEQSLRVISHTSSFFLAR